MTVQRMENRTGPRRACFGRSPKKNAPHKAGRNDFKKFGAGEEIRTPDPRITNALLYQLSYPGEGAEV
jgi:hypothetical protein